MKYHISLSTCAGLLMSLVASAFCLSARADLAGSLKAMAARTQPPVANPNAAPRDVEPLAVYAYYGDFDVPMVRTVVYDNGLVITADPPPDQPTFADVAAYQDSPDQLQPYIRYKSVKLDPDELADLKDGLRLDALSRIGVSYQSDSLPHYRVLIWSNGRIKTILAGGYLYKGDGNTAYLQKIDPAFPDNASDLMDIQRRALPFDLLTAIDTLQNAATSYSKPILPVAWQIRFARPGDTTKSRASSPKTWPSTLPQIDSQQLASSDAPQVATIDQQTATAVRNQERKDKTTVYRIGGADYQVLAVDLYAPLLDHDQWDAIVDSPTK